MSPASDDVRPGGDRPFRYGPAVEDHLARPRNPGPLAGATHVARGTNDACGDELVLYLVVRADRIERAAFQAKGCAPALAAGSITTELVCGLAVADALVLEAIAVERALGGLPRAKRHAATLAIAVLRSALAQKRLQPGPPLVS